MTKYIDILLTKEGYFCVAPPWEVKVGNLVCLPDAVTGKDKILEVVSVVTDDADGDCVKMIETYIGYPLPKITVKYSKKDMEWGENDVVE